MRHGAALTRLGELSGPATVPPLIETGHRFPGPVARSESRPPPSLHRRHVPCVVETRHVHTRPSRGLVGPCMGGTMSTEQIAELLYQALGTVEGGLPVYDTPLRCVQSA